MFVDGRSVTDGDVLEADLAIVGAGAAGMTLARELAVNGRRVLLLESGGETIDAATQDLCAGESVGLPYFPLEAARLRYFGGTTNHWSGTCRPFDAFDMESHDWIPDSGWPFGVSELDAWYPRAAEICAVPSNEWAAEAWVEASRFPALDLDPGRVITRVAQNVRRINRRFVRNFGDEIEAAAGLTVVLNANLVDIALDESAAGVERLRMATLEGTRFSVTARDNILAAGGIENARLLLASNSRYPAGVGNGNDLVGRYFLEHPRFNGGIFVPFDEHLDVRFYEEHDAGGSRIVGYLALPPEVREREELVDVQFRLRPMHPAFYERAADSPDGEAVRSLLGLTEAPGDAWEDLERVADDLTGWRRFIAFGAPAPVPWPEVAAGVATASDEEREALIPEFFGDIATLAYGQTIGNIAVAGVELSSRLEPTPNPDSRVRLGRERDALGMSRVELDWQLTRHDRESAVRGIEILGAELGRAGVGRLRLDIDPESDDWPADNAGGWHHMGTTRMHDDPRHGVVDRDCRVHGLRNLHVAGSSVFPTAGSGTPTMTIVALALRLAAHLESGR